MTTLRRIWLAPAVLSAAIAAHTAHAIGTPAGTAINNTASVSYNVGGQVLGSTSNVTSVTVVQVVDVIATIQTPSVAVTSGDSNRVLVFRVTNTGNGTDTFRLTPNSTIAGDNFDPVLATPAIYFDTDGSGTLTAADVAYVPGGDLTLAADGVVTLLQVNNIPAALTSGDVGRSQLTATRRDGIGPPGTSLAGPVVVGTTGAQAIQTGQYVADSLQLNMVKSQTVVDQFGGNRAIPGATINYVIIVTPSGTGSATTAAFSDPIPANTTYRSGTLKLNTAALTDTTGDDAGQYVAAPVPSITVALGALTAASGPQRVDFAVTIN
jgi:uncharacterized repeat protein (TIGR01451 family)